jgi:hypothetical protein
MKHLCFEGEDGTLFSEQPFGMMSEKQCWNWLSCGACNVMADFFNSHYHWKRMPSTTSCSSLISRLNLAEGPWRGTVLQLLESRDNDQFIPYSDYEQAVDKVGFALWLVDLFVDHYNPSKIPQPPDE